MLIDSSFLVALYNPKDENHNQAMQFARSPRFQPQFSPIVLPEAVYMLRGRIGRVALSAAMRALSSQPKPYIEFLREDLRRADEIMLRYADVELDLVDSCLVAICERLEIPAVCTFDTRDFGIIRPKHRPYLQIFP